jgi:hypothetical protein
LRTTLESSPDRQHWLQSLPVELQDAVVRARKDPTLRRLPRSFRSPPQRSETCKQFLQGRSGDVGCTFVVGLSGEARVRFIGIPERLIGGYVLASFPRAARQAQDVVWSSGPTQGIVRGANPVTADQDMEFHIATVDLPPEVVTDRFSRAVLLSESGRLQPDVSINFDLEVARDI